MWKEFFKLVKQLVTLAENTERNRKEIETLREELRELSLSVEGLKMEFRRFAGNEIHEREKWLLRLENELLRFEKRPQATKANSAEVDRRPHHSRSLKLNFLAGRA